MNLEFKNHPKVKKARKLLMEAEQELRIKRLQEEKIKICKCGHMGSEHGPSHSINYTGGICYKCSCLNFLQKK